ncbi:cell division protein ZapA [Vibrio gallicus]|uniref:cell division protein ZapA n=1 Tax=Vibrio gallicus TaxID=190897 RepID=UPI0021C3B22D|nr:cell division protein ZapA [Vibrio gallicus]
MSSQAVEIEILGKVTRVNCPAGKEDALRQAACDLDKRIQDMVDKTKVANTEKLMTIAALNVCYELLERQTDEQQQSDIEQRLQLLDGKLEQALQSKGQLA